MPLAPDAVQNVEPVSLTEGYRNKFPLFHKLFLSGVEKFGGTETMAPDCAYVRPHIRMRRQKTAERRFWHLNLDFVSRGVRLER
jgi:hypothetical protein